MVSSIQASMWVLLWSTALLGAIMIMVGMVINFFLSGWIADGPVDSLVERREVYLLFGSFTRTMVTMFEVTMGNWMPICRQLMRVTEWYGLVFLLYRLLVSFAVLKVISAIFLCETMKCASLDDDLMIQAKERAKRKFTEKMQLLFRECDTSGDGSVSLDEFVDIMKDSRVQLWLQAMELNIQDPSKFFIMLDVGGDGELNANELITGMGQLKGPCSQLSLATTERTFLKEFQGLRAAQSELRQELAKQQYQAEGINRKLLESHIHELSI